MLIHLVKHVTFSLCFHYQLDEYKQQWERELDQKGHTLIKADSYLRVVPLEDTSGPPTCSDIQQQVLLVEQGTGQLQRGAALRCLPAMFCNQVSRRSGGSGSPWQFWLEQKVSISICFHNLEGGSNCLFSVTSITKHSLLEQVLGCMNMLLSVLREIIVGPWNGCIRFFCVGGGGRGSLKKKRHFIWKSAL